MTYNPIKTIQVTREDGTQEEYRRCDPFPFTFASEKGDILQAELQQPFLHGRTCSVRLHSRTIAVKHLVADAWMPGWEEHGQTIELHDATDPFECGKDNLMIVENRGRGRPRGGQIYDELTAVDVALTVGSLEVAAEELGTTTVTLAKLILKWAPTALLTFDEIPIEIQRMTQFANLAMRHGV